MNLNELPLEPFGEAGRRWAEWAVNGRIDSSDRLAIAMLEQMHWAAKSIDFATFTHVALLSSGIFTEESAMEANIFWSRWCPHEELTPEGVLAFWQGGQAGLLDGGHIARREK